MEIDNKINKFYPINITRGDGKYKNIHKTAHNTWVIFIENNEIIFQLCTSLNGIILR
jgi:hypothetical protein